MSTHMIAAMLPTPVGLHGQSAGSIFARRRVTEVTLSSPASINTKSYWMDSAIRISSWMMASISFTIYYVTKSSLHEAITDNFVLYIRLKRLIEVR